MKLQKLYICIIYDIQVTMSVSWIYNNNNIFQIIKIVVSFEIFVETAHVFISFLLFLL
jgi:hypothetical protein